MAVRASKRAVLKCDQSLHQLNAGQMTAKVSPRVDISRGNRGKKCTKTLKTLRERYMGHVKTIPKVLEQGNRDHVSPQLEESPGYFPFWHEAEDPPDTHS